MNKISKNKKICRRDSSHPQKRPNFPHIAQNPQSTKISDFLRKSSRSKLLSISFKENPEIFLSKGNFGTVNWKSWLTTYFLGHFGLWVSKNRENSATQGPKTSPKSSRNGPQKAKIWCKKWHQGSHCLSNHLTYWDWRYISDYITFWCNWASKIVQKCPK